METSTGKIKNRVMLRVFGIWLVRRVAPLLVFAFLFLALAIHLFAQSVFVAKVFDNAAYAVRNNPVSLITYPAQAFWGARFSVKMEILTAAIMGFLVLWSIKRAIFSYELIRRPKQ